MKITWEEAEKRFHDKHGNRYEYDSSSFTNMENKMNIICRKHGVFSQSPEKHSTGRGCPKCKWDRVKEANRYTWTETIEGFREVHGDRYVYPEQPYENQKQKIRVICKEHGEFITTGDKHTSGSGCRDCAGNKPKTYDEWVSDFRSIHGNKYTYPKQNISCHAKITIICDVHGIFTQRASKHYHHRRGCFLCGKPNRYIATRNTKEEWMVKINKIHGNGKYTYPEVFPHNGNIKIEIVCKEHGVFYQSLLKHAIAGQGCPICRESHGERVISSILQDNGIKYERQKKFDDCKHIFKLSFDFFLPDFNILIEYDGQQHFNAVDYWGGEDALTDVKLRDKIKSEWVLSHPDYTLIRIRYDESIEERLNQLLQSIQHPFTSPTTIHYEVT